MIALPAFYLLWTRHRVFLSGVFVYGGLWLHFALMQRLSWILAALMIAMTVELHWRMRGAFAVNELSDDRGR